MGRKHFREEGDLIALPQVCERSEGKSATNVLHAHTLVVGENGPDGDSLDIWMMLEYGLEEEIEVFGFVTWCASAAWRCCAIFRALFERVATDDASIEGYAERVSNQCDAVLTDGLIQVRIDFVFSRLWGETRSGDELVAIFQAMQQIEAAVFSTAEEGNVLHGIRLFSYELGDPSMSGGDDGLAKRLVFSPT